ncbi:MAG: ABC transporter ATP-binding protein [Alphaproteobacteria bacterium]|nr:MAG: ABC transporter ATP-binding protein [Alphaproteobacteria bacterium]
MSLLSVEALSLSIGGTPILHDVSLAVGPGEILGVIGESGSGKSMTALAIMGLLPRGSRARGRILLSGRDLMPLSDREMCRIRGAEIGMVFQEPMTALNPLRTIGDQVAETVLQHRAAGRGEAMAIARAALERVELPPDRFPPGRYPHELSGGQRQRVVIAMAIALRPKLLICDEPTTALDVTTQAQILKLLKGLVAEQGMGMMFITHDLAVVAGLADRIAVMRDGRVVEDGPTRQLFAAMRHPYTRALRDASAHRPQRSRRSPGTPLLEVRGAVRDYRLPRRSLLGPVPVFRAVDHVSLTIRRGENLGLVGESGCGKSTLTRAILGLEPLQGGVIELDGQRIDAAAGVPPALRRRMQVVFQDPYGSFDPRWRVGRLVAEPFHLVRPRPGAAEIERAVAEALEAVGLSAADRRRFPHEFSGGQRQRIAIARALVTRPELILLDEAVSALDVRVRAQILDLLAELSERFGLSYLFISHDLSVVRAITDRVLVMKAGRIVEEGETEQVFAAPRHAYTRELLAATPRLEDALAAPADG